MTAAKRLFLSPCLAALAMSSGPAQAAVVNTWVQYAPNDTVLLRAVDDTPNAACPSASVDGTPVAMTQRGTSSTSGPNAFPVTMCEATYSAFGHTSAVIAGVTLKMPKANPTRILVIGDTGCRLGSSYPSVQLCDDPQQFPLQYISNYAATFQPDLIVHVGDFYYREYPCPAAQTSASGCGGSPYLDNWASWNADWFTPAASLMAAAPMALTRGNHESCNRGAHGWFQLLDTHFVNDPTNLAAAIPCVGTYSYGSSPPPGWVGLVTTYVGPYDHTEPYLVHAGNVTFLMFDSSDDNTSAPDLSRTTQASDTYPNMTLPAVYEAQLGNILGAVGANPSASPNVVFVTHKSTYDIRSNPANTTQTAGPFSGGDGTMQYVMNFLASGSNNTTPNGVPSAIRMFLAGHDHQFEVVNFSNPNFAPQMTQGNSGTLLDNALPLNAPGSTFPPQTQPGDNGQAYQLVGLSTAAPPTISIKNNADRSEYGFGVWDAIPNQAGSFIVNVYNTASSKLARCQIVLTSRNVVCVQ